MLINLSDGHTLCLNSFASGTVNLLPHFLKIPHLSFLSRLMSLCSTWSRVGSSRGQRLLMPNDGFLSALVLSTLKPNAPLHHHLLILHVMNILFLLSSASRAS